MGTKKKQWQCRQGDVLLERCAAPAASELTGVKQEGGRVVLAHGEATGHAHAIQGVAGLLFEQTKTRRRFLRVVRETELLHEEHHRPEIDQMIALAKGDYEVTIQREYSPEDIRTVAD